jgi:hypothetical protein
VKQLKIEILDQLRRCGSYLLPEPTLLNACFIAVPGCTESEITDALRSLESAGYVIGVRQPVTDTRIWKLTAAGTAALAELRR